ncbi:putative enzyme of the cupin superfamily protein [Paratrimastix pyriformis]|uniref:Enzyme of the cupin superfamily protein n=1 Tax=Paratrimastix pyriformis TaxID=342808 RepID=A0ABQ8UVJ6_9EUKA|nr:putative enzyme of the cupin superfamily protein [Paratrimastix pyriformis]
MSERLLQKASHFLNVGDTNRGSINSLAQMSGPPRPCGGRIEVKTPSPSEVSTAQQWPVWEKEVSEFPWEYEQKEVCLVISGEVEVTSINSNQMPVRFHAGQLVSFPAGLRCVWKVISPIRKHYNFE